MGKKKGGWSHLAQFQFIDRIKPYGRRFNGGAGW